jgi:hypothetical protein
MVVICGRNSDDMFFLTRDGDIEITYTDVFHYANQCLYEQCITEELDKFGRNYVDKLFIWLCNLVHLLPTVADVDVERLSCKKDGDRYIVRLQLSNETLELELSEMVALLERKYNCVSKNQRNTSMA